MCGAHETIRGLVPSPEGEIGAALWGLDTHARFMELLRGSFYALRSWDSHSLWKLLIPLLADASEHRGCCFNNGNVAAERIRWGVMWVMWRRLVFRWKFCYENGVLVVCLRLPLNDAHSPLKKYPLNSRWWHQTGNSSARNPPWKCPWVGFSSVSPLKLYVHSGTLA